MEVIEGTLSLLHHVRTGAPKVTQGPEFSDLIAAVHRSGVSAHPHFAVLLAYYDLTLRYGTALAARPAELGIVLEALCGTAGVRHPHPTVRAQSCFHLRRPHVLAFSA